MTIESRLGVVSWLDFGFTLPLLWSDFDTSPVDTVDGRFGPGDLTVALQVAPLRIKRWVIAARVETKFPTGTFDPSAFAVPLTEGQLDLTFVASVGVSLHPHGYANLEAGWRVRLRKPGNGRKPGDEFLVTAEAGLRLHRQLLLKIVLDGLVGLGGNIKRFGAVTDVPRRRLASLWFGLVYQPRPALTLELLARAFLAGEDLPAGAQGFLGLSYAFALWRPRGVPKR